MADHDRDRAIERLLPQVLGGAASTPCVDGETLAAWSEGTLRKSEAARVEGHVADCARCQAMVGAFVRITPAPPVTESLWQRWRLGWLLPLATAAAAVALWAVIPMTSVRQESQVSLADARRDTPAAEAPPPAPSIAAPSPSLPSTQPEAAAPAAPAPGSPAAPGRGQVMNRAPAATSRGQVMNDDRRAADALAKQSRDQRADAAQVDKPAEAFAPLRETVTVTGTTPPVESVQTLAGQRARNEAPAQPQIEQRKALEERVANARPASPPPAASAPAPAARVPAGAGRAADTALTLITVEPIEIRTPVAATRWRFGPRNTVERTTDDGATWVDVPGVDVNTLRAGAAPTADVCWIVGHNGGVYLSTDGRRLVRMKFPEAVDLVGVTATDARTATVRAADGRSFVTKDGGTTWTAGSPF